MIPYLSDITIAHKLAVPCFATAEAPLAKHDAIKRGAIRAIEVEIVAFAREDGSDCLIDAYFDPAAFNTRLYGHVYGDPTFLAGLKAALAEMGFPTDTLAYTAAEAQDHHCVALESGAPFARAVIERGRAAPTDVSAEAA